MQASKLFLNLVNVSSLLIHHPYACMFSNEYQHTCTCTHTRAHPHRVPLLSFYTSCSPPCVFTQPPELSERKRERYQGLIYKTAHRVQTTACARQAKNTHSQTHTVHACEQNGSVFTVRLGDEEQAFLWNGGGGVEINPSIHSIPSFRLAGPSPVMQRNTQMSQQQSCLHHFTCFEGSVMFFMVILQYDWALQVSRRRERERESILCKLHKCYITMFHFIIWFTLNLPHRYLCDSFPLLAKLSRISSFTKLQHAFPFSLEVEKRKNRKGR